MVQCGSCKYKGMEEYKEDLWSAGAVPRSIIGHTSHSPKRYRCDKIRHVGDTGQFNAYVQDCEGYNGWLIVAENFGCVMGELDG